MTSKALYPSPTNQSAPDVQPWITRVGRHSRCDNCACIGLNPPSGVTVVLDTPTESMAGLMDYGSDDEDNSGMEYLNMCACGHESILHGAGNLEASEFRRRARVALRLDELLQDAGNLLDFGLSSDPDIISLRKQMRLPSPQSATAQHEEPPAKKRKISPSSDLSDEDEEEKPLALAARSKNNTQGSHLSGMKSRAHTAPTTLPPPSDKDLARMNGTALPPAEPVTHEHTTARLDAGQVNRLASGVTVDTAVNGTSDSTVKPEKPAAIELRKGIIEITAVENDGSPRSIVILTGLKTLFQKQLPNMPREYIARLVYDETSKGVAIIKRGYKVAGGIAYRPFPHRGFAEIIFFATASVDQIKGYGAMLMDHFKAHIQKAYPGMLHFLTYADNYAVGYFKKQGFSKEITLDRAVWAGYIKDYEGGTIMQCTMLPKVDYLHKGDIVAAQKEAILSKIREMSKSHIVHPGITSWMKSEDGGGVVEIDPRTIPGLRESGWTPTMVDSTVRATPRSPEYHFMQQLIHGLQNHSLAWAFLAPVNGEEVTDYYDLIPNPMDFGTMEHKLTTHQYTTLETFIADVQLVFDNTRKYNGDESIYAKNAKTLEGFFKKKLREGKQAVEAE